MKGQTPVSNPWNDHPLQDDPLLPHGTEGLIAHGGRDGGLCALVQGSSYCCLGPSVNKCSGTSECSCRWLPSAYFQAQDKRPPNWEQNSLAPSSTSSMSQKGFSSHSSEYILCHWLHITQLNHIAETDWHSRLYSQGQGTSLKVRVGRGAEGNFGL